MKRIISLLLSAIMVMSLAACGGSNETSAPDAPDNAEAVARTDLNMITQVEPDSLDPQATTMQYAYQVLENLNATLLERDATGKIVPALAESYTIDETGTVYTFTLKQGVKFQNGEELTADDIVYTFERGANLTDFAPVESVEALGEYEAAIKLKAPNAPFTASLTKVSMSILNREATEAAGDGFARKPVGCGPYILKEWASGEYITLEAFDDYYKGAPEIKNVKIKFVGDANTALIALESGDTDFSYVYPVASAEDIEANDDLSLAYYDATALQFFTINTQVEKLSNKLVRQAINYAINREDVVIVAAEGLGVPTSQFCNAQTFGYLEGKEGYTYDVEKAKSLMAEAGYADGFTVKVIAQDAMTSKMAQVLSDNLKEINITCEIETQESNTAVNNFMTGNYEIGVLGLNNGAMDFDYIRLIFNYNGTLCLCQAKDENILNQFNEAAALVNDDERLAAYEKLMADIWDAAYYVPVYFPQRAVAMSSALSIDCMRSNGIARIYEMHWN